MKLSLNNFLYGLKQIVTDSGDSTGEGYLRDIPVPLSSLDLPTVRTVTELDAGGTITVAESGVYLTADETNARVAKVEETVDTVARLAFPIPRDYDEAADTLKIRVLASQISVSTDNDVELDSAFYIKAAGVALTADQNPTAPGTILSATEQWIEFDLSGYGLTRDDVGQFVLITNGANDTNGEEILIHAVEIVYRSTLVSYNEKDSSNNDLR